MFMEINHSIKNTINIIPILNLEYFFSIYTFHQENTKRPYIRLNDFKNILKIKLRDEFSDQYVPRIELIQAKNKEDLRRENLQVQMLCNASHNDLNRHDSITS